MGMSIDDNVKKQLLDKLSEEPPMVISTAYVYAKNYVLYGEDITKAWTTAVQQASIIEEVRQKAWVEAYDSFKKEYENRLKADKIAMFKELELEIEEKEQYYQDKFLEQKNAVHDAAMGGRMFGCGECKDLIQQKINALKAEIEPQESEG